jgi:HEAT repeats
MRFKLLSASLCLVAASSFVAFTDGRVGAQEKGKPKAKSPEATIAPEANIEPPVWSPAMPAPAIAPLPPLDFDFDMPDININIDIPPPAIDMGGTWFYDDDSERTEREELRQTYQLSNGARVELSNINGSIDVETTEGNTAELRITSYSYSPNPRKLNVEQTPAGLSVRGEARKGNADSTNFDNTSYRVWLKLPRRVALVVNGVSDNVRVGEIDGSIRVSNVSGNVGVAQAAGAAEVSQVSGSVTLNLARLGAGGVRVGNVSGKVSVRFMDDVNANLQTSGIRGKVYVELPNVAVEGEMNRADFRAKVGTGGAPINISEVSGSVRLARGRTVAEMLGALKGGERSNVRVETARDLTLHVSNRQVRQAFVEVLNGEQNGSVKMTAARALVPYVAEPEVREAFLKSIETGAGNGVVRMTAVRAISKQYAADKTVRDMLLRVLAAEQSDLVRMNIIGAISKHPEDANVQRALSEALRTDRSDIVRMRAASALSKRVEQPDVYALLLNTARSDKKTIVRANALSGLSRRIKERPELRELFVGYLDHESAILQYKALQGLVELGDPALKPRLVEKAKELIAMQTRRQWNDRMLLDTLLLLRRLDAQEADRVMEQLGSELMKSY